MNRNEAEAVAKAIGIADGGCPYCTQDICNELNDAGLGWTFSLDDSVDEYERTAVKVEESATMGGTNE